MTRTALLDKYAGGRLWKRYGDPVQIIDARHTTWDSAYLRWANLDGTGGRWIAERNLVRYYREIPSPDLWEAFTEDDQFRELGKGDESLYSPFFRDDPTIDAECAKCGPIRLDASGLCPVCGAALYL